MVNGKMVKRKVVVFGKENQVFLMLANGIQIQLMALVFLLKTIHDIKDNSSIS